MQVINKLSGQWLY